MGQSISMSSLLPLRWRLWFSHRFYFPLGPSTYRVSPHRVIKGPCDPVEVEAMEYVSTRTSIPIPKVHAIHREKGLIYIEMEYVQGSDLGSAWKHLSTKQKEAVFAELKYHVSSLRGLQPPAEHQVSSALQNPVYDCRVGARFFGPMSHVDFHYLTRSKCPMDMVEEYFGPELVHTHTTKYRTCFTHADLNPRNILVRNGHIVAIIDWAFSGWYPEYWEFTKAFYNYVSEEWEEYLRKAIPIYETELTGERVLWRMLPEPGTETEFFRDGVRISRPGSTPSATWLEAREGSEVDDLWSLVLQRRSPFSNS